MFSNLFRRKPHLNQLCWHTSYNGIRRKRLRYHCSCCHNAASANGNSFQNGNICPAPYIIFNDNWSIMLWAFIFIRHIHDVLSDDVYPMITRDDGRFRTKYHLLADCQWSNRAIERTSLRNTRPVTYRQVPQPFEVATHRSQIHTFSAMLHCSFIHRAPKLVPKIG